MDRPTDKLIDSAIDVEIERLLAVEPSPDFLARVRMRLADEPVRAERHFRSVFLTTAAIAAIIVIVVGLSRFNQTSIDRLPRPEQSFSQAPSPRVPSRPQAENPAAVAIPTSKRTRPASVRRRPAAITSTTSLDSPAEPEVLVSVAEAQALRRFLENVREGRVDLATAVLPTATDNYSDLVDIHPLIPVTIPEGVLQ
jgi:hypothetical protein